MRRERERERGYFPKKNREDIEKNAMFTVTTLLSAPKTKSHLHTIVFVSLAFVNILALYAEYNYRG